MATVLFVNPVVREEDNPRHVPYGMALLAAICGERGHRVQVFDANAWRAGDDVLTECLEAHPWEVVAIGGISTTYTYVEKAVRLMTRHAPQALVVCGGGLLTSLPLEIMELIPGIDVGVVGEGFETFPELLEALDAAGEDGPDFDRVNGLVWRRASGAPVLSPQRALLADIDTLPYPAWDLFPLDIYFANSAVLFSEEGMVARRRLDINASYGCNLICRYCFHLGISGDLEYVEGAAGRDVSFTHNRLIRYHSPRYVVDLVEHARDRHGVDFIGFLDENLMTMDVASGRTWMAEICRLWIEEGLQPSCIAEGRPHDENCRGVHWSGTSHATLCNPGILGKMRQAGCSHLVYGYETFSPRVMKTIGKGATPATNERSLKWTMAAGIRPIPNLIVGFPDEDFDSIKETMIAAERLGIVCRPHFATPYPGSEWYTLYKERILAQYGGSLDRFLRDLGDASRLTALISKKFNAVELYGLRELMVDGDLERVEEYERVWKALHGERQSEPPLASPCAVA